MEGNLLSRAEARDRATQLNFRDNFGQINFHDSRQPRPVPDSAFKGSVRQLPRRYVPRTDIVDRALKSLTSDRVVALVGMGGAGKTTLAKAIGLAENTRAAFSGRILWVDAAQAADPIAIQERIAQQLYGGAASFRSITEGRQYLDRLIGDESTLLIIDDVWDSEILDALDFVRPEGAVLFTTRDREVAKNHGATVREVDELSDDEARALLSHWTATPADRLPAEAHSLHRKVGNLALGVAIIGAMVVNMPADTKSSAWKKVLSLLNDTYITDIDAKYNLDGYAHPSVLASIALSIDHLPQDKQDRYRELAVFRGRGSFPSEAVSALWASAGLTAPRTDYLLSQLVGRCLVQCDSAGQYSLHALEFDVADKQLAASPSGVVGAHRSLIRGYHDRIAAPSSTPHRSGTPRSWPDGPDDGYLLQNLAFHLAQSNLRGQLDALLLSFAWMERKLATTGVSDLLTDYTHHVQDEERSTPVETVHDALQLSAVALSRDPLLLAGQLVGRLLGNHDPEICGLVESAQPPDGHLWLRPYAVGSLTRPGGPYERHFPCTDGPVKAVDISADGALIATGSGKTVQVWERWTHELKQTLTSHGREVTAVAITSDGLSIVSGGRDRTVRISVVITGYEQRELSIDAGAVNAVAVTEDRRLIVVGSGKNLQIWNQPDGPWEPELREHTQRVQAVALSADDRCIVSGSYDGTICVWDRNTADLLYRLPTPAAPVTALAVSATGRYVTYGCADGAVHFWDVEQLDTTQLPGNHPGGVHAVAITAYGERIFSAGEDPIILVHNRIDATVATALRGHQGAVHALALSRDNQSLASGSHDGTVRVWDLTRMQDGRSHGDHTDMAITALAFTTEDQLIYTQYDQPVKIRNLVDYEVTQPLRAEGSSTVQTAAVTPDRTRLICVGESISVWDLSSGRCLYTSNEHRKSVNAVAISPDGHYVVTGSSDKTARVWELLDNGHLRHVQTLTDAKCREIYAVAFTPDGRQVITAGFDKVLRVWDRETGSLAHAPLTGHDARISSVAVSPDGRYIISGSHDGTVRIWSLDSRECVRALTDHTGKVTTVVVADGGRILSGGSDNTLRLWDLNMGTQLAWWLTDATQITVCASHPDDPTMLAYGDASGRTGVLSICEPRTTATGS